MAQTIVVRNMEKPLEICRNCSTRWRTKYRTLPNRQYATIPPDWID